jgi:2-C-methyl-D-erythritol 4-phosphate cytidylyltransferase
MAYLRDIEHERCRTCTYRKATHRLFNRYNAEIGAYCSMHAKRALKQLKAGEHVAEELPKPKAT